MLCCWITLHRDKVFLTVLSLSSSNKKKSINRNGCESSGSAWGLSDAVWASKGKQVVRKTTGGCQVSWSVDPIYCQLKLTAGHPFIRRSDQDPDTSQVRKRRDLLTSLWNAERPWRERHWAPPEVGEITPESGYVWLPGKMEVTMTWIMHACFLRAVSDGPFPSDRSVPLRPRRSLCNQENC